MPTAFPTSREARQPASCVRPLLTTAPASRSLHVCRAPRRETCSSPVAQPAPVPRRRAHPDRPAFPGPEDRLLAEFLQAPADAFRMNAMARAPGRARGHCHAVCRLGARSRQLHVMREPSRARLTSDTALLLLSGIGLVARHAVSRSWSGPADDCIPRMKRKSNHARSTSCPALLLLQGSDYRFATVAIAAPNARP